MHTAAAEPRTPPFQRSAALAGGALLAGAAALVAVVDPSSPDSVFPRCALHAVTGLWCPGCGLTRATHQLLNGNPVMALGSNLFVPLVLGAIVMTWLVWVCRAFGRPIRSIAERLPDQFAMVIGVAMVAYTVLRNLPVASLRWLAP
ncbi:MAG: DUF2752 domain-containing protein [Ilumatobacteraceae bacterium]